jgi:hypothetical protein
MDIYDCGFIANRGDRLRSMLFGWTIIKENLLDGDMIMKEKRYGAFGFCF